MRLGLIARMDNSGLGVQTHEFYKAMKPAKTMVVDISHLNGGKIHPERYPNATFIIGFPTIEDIVSFLQDLDVVFIAESAYNPEFYRLASEMGVKTVVQYNWEFFDWLNGSTPLPDMFIAPSMWHFADVNAWVNHTNLHIGSNIAHVYLHCPVNRELLPYRKITEARTFLHIVGKAAAHDRNGTETVIKAGKYLKTKAQILIHFQGEQGLAHQVTRTLPEYMSLLAHEKVENVTIQQNDFDNYADIYKQGDVLLLPRRYGGNCLPMNEALSVGMPVLMPDISPNTGFLPDHWLLPAKKIGEFTPRTKVDIYDVDPKDLAAKIDEFYELGIEMHNEIANVLANRISWSNMKPQYERVLGELCNV